MLTNTIIPKFDYDIEPFFTSEDMSNKLFCTFSTEEGLDDVLNNILFVLNINPKHLNSLTLIFDHF